MWSMRVLRSASISLFRGPPGGQRRTLQQERTELSPCNTKKDGIALTRLAPGTNVCCQAPMACSSLVSAVPQAC